MSVEMDDLVTKVRATHTVADSAIAAFAGVGQMILDVAGDKAKSIELGNETIAKAAALAAAIPVNPT